MFASDRHSALRAATSIIILAAFAACVTAGRRTAAAPMDPGHTAWVAKRVAEIRGIPIVDPISVDRVSRQEIARQFAKAAEESLGGDQSMRRMRADVALGFMDGLPADGAASRPFTTADLGVSGTYDPKTGKIIVINDLEVARGPGFSEITFAHEVAHQFDDMRHDLYKLQLDARGNSDRALAVRALIEGSAMLTQLDFMMAENYENSSGFAGAAAVSRTLDDLESDFGIFSRMQRSGNRAAFDLLQLTPRHARERLVFPYGRGLAFARALNMRRGYSAIDDALADPPRSTEQLLHPEKFADERDDPSDIQLDTSFLGSAPVHEDTLGEFGIRQWFELFIDYKTAWHAAAGWGGDRYRVVEAGGRDVLLWHTDWDTPGDALEFARAAVLLFSKRYKIPGHFMSEQGYGNMTRPDGSIIQIQRSGSSVIIVDGAPADTDWASILERHDRVAKAERTPRSPSFLAGLLKPIVAVDTHTDGGGFNLFGGLLVSESHRRDARNFSILGGALLDIQKNGDGSRVSFLFGLISWRTAPRQDLSKVRIGVSTFASDRESNAWSVLPLINAPAASRAPGGRTLRFGLLNLQSGFQLKFDENGGITEGGQTSGETSVGLGIAGHAWTDRLQADGTPYKRDFWYFPFEMGFSTNSETAGPIAGDPAASQPSSQPVDRLRLRPGDMETLVKTQFLGELLFTYESSALYRADEQIAGVTNWSSVGGLIASGGRRGREWMFRTPLVGWGQLGGENYIIFFWGLIPVAVGAVDEPASAGAAYEHAAASGATEEK